MRSAAIGPLPCPGTTPGADTVSGTGLAGISFGAFTSYGRIPQATPGTGLYEDTITVTVTY